MIHAADADKRNPCNKRTRTSPAWHFITTPYISLKPATARFSYHSINRQWRGGMNRAVVQCRLRARSALGFVHLTSCVLAKAVNERPQERSDNTRAEQCPKRMAGEFRGGCDWNVTSPSPLDFSLREPPLNYYDTENTRQEFYNTSS